MPGSSSASNPEGALAGNPARSEPSEGYEKPSRPQVVDPEREHEMELVRRAQEGDREAFAELVEASGDRLYGFMLHLAGGDGDLAAEFTQEAFVRAWEKIRLFSGGSRFYTWLYRLARNRALDLMAKHKPLAVERDTLEAIGPGSRDPAELEREELREQVRRGIAELAPEQREIILLRDFEDLDYETIAGRLECAVGTVKSRLNRARTALRERLGHLAGEFG